MIVELGHFTLVLALVFSIMQAVCGFSGVAGNELIGSMQLRLLRLAPFNFLWGFNLCVCH